MQHPLWNKLPRHGVTALLLLLAGCIPKMGWQGTGGITGVVTDSLCNPIQGATVRVWGTSPARGGITRANGIFTIKGLRPGRYTLDFSAVGYKRDSIAGVDVIDHHDSEVEKILSVTSPGSQAPSTGITDYTSIGTIMHSLPTGTIQASINDTYGRSVPNATVELIGPLYSHGSQYMDLKTFFRTDVLPRTYKLRISHPHYHSLLVEDVVVAADSISQVAVRLTRKSDMELGSILGHHPFIHGKMGTIRATNYDVRGKRVRR